MELGKKIGVVAAESRTVAGLDVDICLHFSGVDIAVHVQRHRFAINPAFVKAGDFTMRHHDQLIKRPVLHFEQRPHPARQVFPDIDAARGGRLADHRLNFRLRDADAGLQCAGNGA